MDRLFLRTKCITTISVIVLVLSTPLLAQAGSSDSSWNKAKAEVKAMLGQVPNEFTHIPDYMRGTFWQWFKANNSPKASIPPKYAELIGLGVAAQIPCSYCVYIHTKQAKMYGATDEEIREAVAEAALTRYMSTISNGNPQDFNVFKSQWDKILKYVQTHKK